MVLSLFTRAHSLREERTSQLLWHPECPIEQSVRMRDSARQSALLRETWRSRTPGADVIYVADASALRMLGCSEDALKHAVTQLERRHGQGLVVEAPSIRYVYGANVLEPWMEVLVNAPERCAFMVERDFQRRRGDIRRLSLEGAACVLEGEAPLADLLGYTEWLAELTGPTPNVAIWLSRYLPIDRGPRSA